MKGFPTGDTRRNFGTRKKFKATTDSRHNLPVAENLLDQKFATTRPNQVWVSDIMYVPAGEGWLCFAGHQDLLNGEFVGYAMGNKDQQGSGASVAVPGGGQSAAGERFDSSF